MDAELKKLDKELFELHGELSFETALSLYKMSKRLFNTDADSVCVDLAEVTRIDSAGLSVLLEWMRRGQHFQKDIRYKNIPTQVLSLMRISGLETILPRA